MTRIINGYFNLLKFLIVLCLALMVILVFGNVVLRYVFNLGITISEELSRWLFVWLTFLGAIVAMREHGHLGMDTVVKRLPPIGKKICFLTSQLLMLYAIWLFFQGSWQQTLINLHVTAPASGLSVALFYGIGVLFSVSAAAIVLHDLYRLLSGKLTVDEMVMVKESEEEEEPKELEKESAMQEHLPMKSVAAAANESTRRPA